MDIKYADLENYLSALKGDDANKDNLTIGSSLIVYANLTFGYGGYGFTLERWQAILENPNKNDEAELALSSFFKENPPPFWMVAHPNDWSKDQHVSFLKELGIKLN